MNKTSTVLEISKHIFNNQCLFPSHKLRKKPFLFCSTNCLKCTHRTVGYHRQHPCVLDAGVPTRLFQPARAPGSKRSCWMTIFTAGSTWYTGTNVQKTVWTNISWCFEQGKELKTGEVDSNMKGNRGFVWTCLQMCGRRKSYWVETSFEEFRRRLEGSGIHWRTRDVSMWSWRHYVWCSRA